MRTPQSAVRSANAATQSSRNFLRFVQELVRWEVSVFPQVVAFQSLQSYLGSNRTESSYNFTPDQIEVVKGHDALRGSAVQGLQQLGILDSSSRGLTFRMSCASFSRAHYRDH